MDSKYLQKIKEFIYSKDKIKLVVLIGILGMALILISEVIPTGDEQNVTEVNGEFSISEYIAQLEEKTADIIGSIDGVGQCKVMITVKESNENVYAKNVDEQSQQGYYSENNEYVLYEGENGETPVLIKEYYPQIQGVVVVCDGGDNIEVKEQIISSITSLYDISSSNISISKINQKR